MTRLPQGVIVEPVLLTHIEAARGHSQPSQIPINRP